MKFPKRLLMKVDGSGVSMTKVGLIIAGIAGGAITSTICPPALIPYIKFVAIIGGVIAGAGARDVMGGEKKE